MGKPTGFMEYEREDCLTVSPEERIKSFEEFHTGLPLKQQQLQGARCMACGVPFCQSGMMIGGMVSGCPLHNLVPETNELVYRGNWEMAYERLAMTHSFPEFTSRVCPALCEAACTCGYDGEAVATRDNERAIIDYAFEKGLVKEPAPATRSGKTVAVIGSGPSGLAAAQLLNRRGHKVTVFERSDRPGGLLRYGIPNMKLDKRTLDRRIDLLKEAGVEFRCGVDVGRNLSAEEICKSFDRVILCCGASKPRDIQVPGREAKGIYFAVDFLKEVSKKLMDNDYDSKAVLTAENFSFGSLKGKQIIVIGGGDTGNDCVGTSVRLGAAGVTQLEMMPAPPVCRAESNPWPEWPKVLKTDYGQEEAICKYGKDPRVFRTTVTEFVKDKKDHVCAVKTVELERKVDAATGRVSMEPVPGSEKELKADLVLIAAGFLGSEDYVAEQFGVERNARTNIQSPQGGFATSRPGVFAAGDVHRGQSLVVWAIREGRDAAMEVDASLM